MTVSNRLISLIYEHMKQLHWDKNRKITQNTRIQDNDSILDDFKAGKNIKNQKEAGKVK